MPMDWYSWNLEVSDRISLHQFQKALNSRQVASILKPTTSLNGRSGHDVCRCRLKLSQESFRKLLRNKCLHSKTASMKAAHDNHAGQMNCVSAVRLQISASGINSSNLQCNCVVICTTMRVLKHTSCLMGFPNTSKHVCRTKSKP